MGYNTHFVLTVNDEARLEEVKEYISATLFGGKVRDEIPELFDGGVTWKWYDFAKDMAAVSQAFPDVVFALEGEGEERGDKWTAKFYNGAYFPVPRLEAFIIHKVGETKWAAWMEEFKAMRDPAAVPGAPRARGARKVEALAGKIAKLSPGKVLDVSGITANGAGTRVVPQPGPRSKKYRSPNLPIVSSDLDHYITAVRMLPGGETRHAADVEHVRRLFGTP